MSDKLDKISDDIGAIKVTLAGQAVDLKEHMRRTAILENEFKPVRDQIMRWRGALAVLLALISISEILLHLRMK